MPCATKNVKIFNFVPTNLGDVPTSCVYSHVRIRGVKLGAGIVLVMAMLSDTKWPYLTEQRMLTNVADSDAPTFPDECWQKSATLSDN